MKKYFLTLALLIFASPFAFASTSPSDELSCQVMRNTEIVSKIVFKAPLQEVVNLGQVDAFRLKVKNLGNSVFEIEVYDEDAPSRGYAKGSLRTPEDEIRWVLWRRDIILEVACQKEI